MLPHPPIPPALSHSLMVLLTSSGTIRHDREKLNSTRLSVHVLHPQRLPDAKTSDLANSIPK
jgi:hypothetical protein